MYDKTALDKALYVIRDLGYDIKPEIFLKKFSSGEMKIPDAYEELLLEDFLVTKKIEEYEVVVGSTLAFSEEDAKIRLNGTKAYLLG